MPEKTSAILGLLQVYKLLLLNSVEVFLNIENASSCEFDAALRLKILEAIVVYMPEIDQENLGGTMRLGIRTIISLRTLKYPKFKRYMVDLNVQERHRHRYEVNPDLIPKLESKGLKFVGKDVSLIRCEI